ncbi:hypothetical protein Ga0466249_002291 [Sporomusaceae bacterium BoRhaA]|uniref:hypothetical protein n=1 Tax=Pelorhabdus rhamnosifermentans TaxID=2772457 RepID=UPI001C06187A|nr:hypothetical protein [Pelorhabdus rhamnosifermentans]MBU2701177.1 hypothetical protein [Pelorhabdus rhamnosifermentans]
MRFTVKIPITKTLTVQKVVNKVWVDSGTISGDLQPLKTRTTNANSIGLPYKNSHQFFTNDVANYNTRYIDGNDIYLVIEPKDWFNHRQVLLARVIMDDSVSITGTRVTGVKPDGSPVTQTGITIASMPCTLVPDKGDVTVTTSGSTVLTTLEMYCNLSDIKEKDIITDLSTSSKYKVLNVKNYNQIAYQKIKLQGGVL